MGRLAGDEFVVLLRGLDKPLDAASVARRLLDELNRPLILQGTKVRVNASIGITMFPDDGATADELIRTANIAMYHPKERGKNHFQFYIQSLNTELLRRIELEAGLRKARERQQLLLHYQVQVDSITGEVVGIESLLRWQHPQDGLISPSDFIPLAAETGLIIPIGNWVLHETCRQGKAWQDAGARPVPVAVNISARQFAGKNLEDSIREALDETGLAPEHLTIELTETSVMDDPESALSTLASLKAIGIRIAMDDFGTGYSSLGILKRLPIDCLKIDKSFVGEIPDTHSDAAITMAIMAMARSLGLNVIAEGVERPEQTAFLSTHGCNVIQGYPVSRPLPARDIEPVLTAPTAAPPPSWAEQLNLCLHDTARGRLKVLR